MGPQLDPDEIPAPESSYLRWFYRMSKRINTSLAARTAIFSVVSLFAITSAVLDVLTAECLGGDTIETFSARVSA